MVGVGQGEGSFHFFGFWGSNCITFKSGTSCTVCEELGFTMVLTTLCNLVEGLFSQSRACPSRNEDDDSGLCPSSQSVPGELYSGNEPDSEPNRLGFSELS